MVHLWFRFDVGILDDSKALVVSYTYDSWGKLLSTTGSLASTVGVKNPYRYRGYRYDTETGLYYLNSRYYDPQVGRFVNADFRIISDISGKNQYQYCKKNYPNMNDNSGKRPLSISDLDIETAEDRTLSISSMRDSALLFSKNRHSQPDSGLRDVSDEEVQKRARDKNLSGEERRKYQEEEKYRDLRNKQKRQDKYRNIDLEIVFDSPSTMSATAITIGTLGAGYLAYKGLRLLPSLLPMFWWSIPLNLLSP